MYRVLKTRGMLMCKYIFPAHWLNVHRFFIPRGGTVWYTMTMWWFTKNYEMVLIKQKNIISKKITGLNGFTAKQLLYAAKYKCHCHLKVVVVNKQPVIKILILKLLKTFWEYGRDHEYEPVEVRSDDGRDGKIICSNWTLPSFKR